MRILAFYNICGKRGILPHLLDTIKLVSPEVVCIIGDILDAHQRFEMWFNPSAGGSSFDTSDEEIRKSREDLLFYRDFYQILSVVKIPILILAGAGDAPEDRFYAELMNFCFKTDNMKIQQENIIRINNHLFFGFGGMITKNLYENKTIIAYPQDFLRFSARRLKYLVNIKITLFYTPPITSLPQGKNQYQSNSFLNDLIDDLQCDVVICGGMPNIQGKAKINKTLVVKPRAAYYKKCALIDSQTKKVEFLNFAE